MRFTVEIWGNTVRFVEHKCNSARKRKLPHTASGRLPIDHTKVDEGQFWEEVWEREDRRFDNSISRAKTAVREYALCNKWEYFCTFTLDENKQNRFDLKEWKKAFGNWIGHYNRKYGADLVYLFIPEQHVSGAWHGLGLLSGVSEQSLVRNEYGYLDLPYYRNRFGYISLSPIRDAERCASYVSKYITKSANGTAEQLEKGARLYLSSRGLSKRRKIGLAECECFNADWSNEYVGIATRKATDALAFLDECQLLDGLDNDEIINELTILGKESGLK